MLKGRKLERKKRKGREREREREMIVVNQVRVESGPKFRPTRLVNCNLDSSSPFPTALSIASIFPHLVFFLLFFSFLLSCTFTLILILCISLNMVRLACDRSMVISLTICALARRQTFPTYAVSLSRQEQRQKKTNTPEPLCV